MKCSHPVKFLATHSLKPGALSAKYCALLHNTVESHEGMLPTWFFPTLWTEVMSAKTDWLAYEKGNDVEIGMSEVQVLIWSLFNPQSSHSLPTSMIELDWQEKKKTFGI